MDVGGACLRAIGQRLQDCRQGPKTFGLLTGRRGFYDTCQCGWHAEVEKIMQGVQSAIYIAGLAVAGLLVGAGGAQAQLTEADIGVNPTFEQTDATTVNPTGGFFSARAFVTNQSDFDGGTLTYAGPGSPQALSYVPADVAWEFSDSNANFADLQAAYPNVGYQFDLTGGTMGPLSVSVNYAGNAYSNTPQLEAASFNALQGLNAADSVTLDFNAMDVSPNANGDNSIILSITNSSNMTVFSTPALPTDATSVTIPGGVLAAGQTYSFDLLFDDRIVVDNTEQFYDTHTGGTFFTAGGAVPEPSTWAMMAIGFAGLGFLGWRGSRKTAAHAA
jgi:hypothetical protein